MPGLAFLDTTMHRHRDFLQREYHGPEEDRYLSPSDGHLEKLVVQAAQDVYDGPANSTWRRTFIRNASPIYIHVANFPFNTLPIDDSLWTSDDWAMVALKWLPACVGLLCVIWVNPTGADGVVRNHGKFDPFPYRHWLYPEIARNKFENSEPARATDPETERILGPRELCFLPKSGENDGFAIPRRVEAYEQDTQYVFIGYTAEQFSHDSPEDMEALDLIATRAAREAEVPAYWVASCCMSDPDELVNDVFRISDVMRGAHSLIIAIGPSRTRKMDDVNSQEEMLRIWGERMWTLPEALLCSNEHPIKVYTRGRDTHEPAWSISKKHFAAVVWDDPLVSRQLVDHFLNSLELSRLELVTISLKCLSRRKTHRKFNGDVSYALMGLVRRRPVVEPRDSEFMAFARLSLANDSDCLLERLVCTQPKTPLGDWDDMDDAWDAKLWDIIPHCQVAGIGPGDTVILDGAFGAAIRWKSFAPVAFMERTSWKRTFAQVAIHGAPAYFITGLSLVARFSEVPSVAAFGAFLLACSLIVILMFPYLVRLLYIGKMWGAQPWFFWVRRIYGPTNNRVPYIRLQDDAPQVESSRESDIKTCQELQW